MTHRNQLTPIELQEMTGYKRGCDQARWLRSAYPSLVIQQNAAGVPVVTWDAINTAIAGQRAPARAPAAGPNWSRAA